jgi:hypothetical protein
VASRPNPGSLANLLAKRRFWGSAAAFLQENPTKRAGGEGRNRASKVANDVDNMPDFTDHSSGLCHYWEPQDLPGLLAILLATT